MPLDISRSLLQDFDLQYDTTIEDQATQSRGDFLAAFPLSHLRNITLNEYVIGTGRATFCMYVEVKTRPWASVLGSSAFKFGIYYGRTKSDSRRRYRFAKGKFGKNETDAFTAVKQSLLDLVDAGRSQQFNEVDKNKLSQMFKAKILCLYFPNIFMNVCSADHIEKLASIMEFPQDIPVSEQQHLLLEEKLQNQITRGWSNPKFMTFLYNTYITPNDKRHLKVFRKRKPPKIDIDEMLENRKRIGKISEEYALRWEKKRLIGSGYKQLVKKIDDRRDRPAYGYDFRSHTDANQERFIEVKTAGRNWAGAGYRFFLSENELSVSKSNEHKRNYYFYLVFYEEGEPAGLEAWKATDLYDISEFGPNGHIVSFDQDRLD